ncbi:hypothetical protein HBI67_065040 [Parastagonospora nodorum]|nr:hypothetical protein HBI67_065040 [Parastagonospora nodorum]
MLFEAGVVKLQTWAMDTERNSGAEYSSLPFDRFVVVGSVGLLRALGTTSRPMERACQKVAGNDSP